MIPKCMRKCYIISYTLYDGKARVNGRTKRPKKHGSKRETNRKKMWKRHAECEGKGNIASHLLHTIQSQQIAWQYHKKDKMKKKNNVRRKKTRSQHEYIRTRIHTHTRTHGLMLEHRELHHNQHKCASRLCIRVHCVLCVYTQLHLYTHCFQLSINTHITIVLNWEKFFLRLSTY